MKFTITKENVDAAKAALDAAQTNICMCCPVWQALRPLIDDDRFSVGITNVSRTLNSGHPEAGHSIGHLSVGGDKATLTCSKDWDTLVGHEFEFEYEPVTPYKAPLQDLASPTSA